MTDTGHWEPVTGVPVHIFRIRFRSGTPGCPGLRTEKVTGKFGSQDVIIWNVSATVNLSLLDGGAHLPWWCQQQILVVSYTGRENVSDENTFQLRHYCRLSTAGYSVSIRASSLVTNRLAVRSSTTATKYGTDYRLALEWPRHKLHNRRERRDHRSWKTFLQVHSQMTRSYVNYEKSSLMTYV